MNRPPVYIAAPYGAPTGELMRLNTQRAELLGRLAMLEGLTPVVVHSGILAGIFGDDTKPEQRADGLEATLVILHLVASREDGRFWLLTRDDGVISDGAASEWSQWGVHRGESHDPDLAKNWDGYRRYRRCPC